MRIAVMAAGAVGGYFGARLASSGHEVHFVARGAHRDAIAKGGLKVESMLGALHLKDAKVTDDPAQVGPVDIVLFAVKLWDTEKAGEQARPLMGKDTRLITLQNGVDSVERLAPILGPDHVVGGAANIATVIAEPGVIKHTSPFARIVCGRLDGKPDAKLDAFAAAAKSAGIDIVVTGAMQRELWNKFIFLTAMSALTTAARRPIGDIVSQPNGKALFRAMMEEVAAVGRARGVDLLPNVIEERMALLENVPPQMKASMCHDIERGNRLELDWLSGKVVTLGRDAKVPTPLHAMIYALLEPYRMGKPA